jgi:beta-glucosidase-like glycosyl hydrolase/CubicO group peptidase (beta-lactamase class C family)
MMKKVSLSIFVILLVIINLLAFPETANSIKKKKKKKPVKTERVVPFKEPIKYELHTPWVDSVFNSLSAEERIAQLMMVTAYSNRDQKYIDDILLLIKKYNVGGIIFFQGGPMRQAAQTNLYQSYAKTPLMISIDGEWGLSMRLDSTMSFPRSMMQGAITDDSLIYQMGREVALQMRAMGIHINFAPVVDINNNPRNPVINNRSYGENKYAVARKALMYMKGMQDYGLITTLKHFPGHGDTDNDSHLTLPLICADTTRLDTLELFPFKQLFAENAGGVMVAHLSIPSIDTTPNLPSSLNPKVVTNLLKQKMGFNGLVFTDALSKMRGVTDYFKPGEIELKALQAGVDVLLMPQDVPKAIKYIQEAVLAGTLRQSQIDSSCRKVLAAKEWLRLKHYYKVNLKKLKDQLSTPEANVVQRQIISSAITLVQNQNNIVPLKSIDTLRMACVLLGTDAPTKFSETLSLYGKIDCFYLPKKADSAYNDTLVKLLKPYNLLIAGVVNTDYKPTKNFGIAQNAIRLLDSLVLNKDIILDLFATPYSLSYFSHIDKYKAVLVSYEDLPVVQDYSAQAIFGAIPLKGKLPVSAGQFPLNAGIETSKTIRLAYKLPEEIGIDSKQLSEIDTIVMDAIRHQAMPGCQVLAAKNGVVFYNKAFGKFTYDSAGHIVTTNDLYDIASITKIAATLPMLMKLYDEDKIDLKASLGDYLPELKNTNKYNAQLIDVLTHQAKFEPFIPFYLDLLEPVNSEEKLSPTNVKFRKGLVTKTKDDYHTIQIADSLYLLTSYADTIWNQTHASPLLSSKKYVYSDIDFYYLYRIAQRFSSQPFNKEVDSLFYSKLGANNMGYLPLSRFSRTIIAPTENDMLFRRQVITGYVHDQGAAMLGGVCGHAGVFANANDVAKLMQMYLNGGSYGGQQFIEPSTIGQFTQAPFAMSGNRRGIGFDKPERGSKSGPVCDCVSEYSFGHSGFTGCLTWADPQTGLLYVFLSNRVYPDASNKKLASMDVRTRIQEVLANAINP